MQACGAAWGWLTPQHSNALCINSGAYALLRSACIEAEGIQLILRVSFLSICPGNVKTCPIHINSATVWRSGAFYSKHQHQPYHSLSASPSILQDKRQYPADTRFKCRIPKARARSRSTQCHSFLAMGSRPTNATACTALSKIARPRSCRY
jgi:hypothetical protein